MVVAYFIPIPPALPHALLREAGRRGLRVLDGLGMLVNQGLIGFNTGRASTPKIPRS